MQLYTAAYAPNPRRVTMFIAEKGISGITEVPVNLQAGGHRDPEFLARNPFGRVPVLALDDGRMLSETRAICTYLEGLQPEPNLMGTDPFDRAFIDMADRRMEMYVLQQIVNWVRHCHPAMGFLEQPQIPAFGEAESGRLQTSLAWLDGQLAREEYVAGPRFTIADITAFCALEFARGMMKWKPGDAGFAHVQGWRDRIAARPSCGRP